MRECTLNNSDVNGRRGMAMVEIKPEKVRKDNKNLYRMEGRGKELDRDLKKLRGKNPDYEEIGALIEYYTVLNYGSVDVYDELIFRMDMEKFKSSLSESNQKVLDMLTDHIPVKIIAEDLQLPVKTVYSKMYKLRDMLEDYFKEE